MTALKITSFLGIAPKNATELLPDTGAQVAENCKLYSGDLIPYPLPVVAGTTGRTGETRTLYALRDLDTSEPVWLSWAGDVDIVTPAADELTEQRFYYAGDGKPKVSTYALATAGAGPYPTGGYELGLPLPSATPFAVPTPFTPVASATFARDASNNVTLTTGSPHNLKTGAFVTVSGFAYRTGTYSQSSNTVTITIAGHGLSSGAQIFMEYTSGGAISGSYNIAVVDGNTFTTVAPDTVDPAAPRTGNVRWDIRDLNISTEVTVVNSTRLTYTAAGPQIAVTANSDGRVDLGGAILARNYLYTWYTPWQEESVGSIPSDPLFIKEGQIVTVSNLPITPPNGDTFIRGIRLYRSLSGSGGTSEFFRLATLWFPNPLVSLFRTADNIATITLESPHNLLAGDRFRISGGSPSINIPNGVVTEIVDQYTFKCIQGGGLAAVTNPGGSLYYDIAERETDPPRYWGEANSDFTDDFSFRSLLNILATDNYNPPPADLQGLTVLKNNILVGFVGNDLYFSEPDKFHAWPSEYKKSLEHNIVKLVPISGDILVLTDNYPYQISGSDPRTLAVQKIDARYPCVSRRSVAVTPTGVVYASHDGLILASTLTGAQVFTARVHSSDTWGEALDPATVVGANYKEVYFASHSAGSFVYEVAERGASFVNSTYTFTATWYDPLTNALYYTSGEDGTIYRWDDLSQPAAIMEWKSKTYITPKYTNVGAGRVVADYIGAVLPSRWDTTEENWETMDEDWDQAEPLTFQMWVDKELIFTTTLTDSGIFRLPAGYKSDTFEFGVSGTIRVRSIHIAETPTLLVGV